MRKFILGTDWGGDCDDTAALRIILRKEDEGNIKLLAIGINDSSSPYSASSVEAFLNLHQKSNIPIGIDLKANDYCKNPRYQKNLALSSKTRIKSNEDAEDAASLYRRILENSDEKIEIMEIGFSNVLEELLRSDGGIELVRNKVSKIWMMAGKWDEENGKEYNFYRTARSRKAASYVLKNCPVPIIFLGFEVGRDVISGSALKKDDILYKIFSDFGAENGRSSWDPMLVLLAITGDIEKAGYTSVTGYASLCEETGENNFIKDENGPHKYVVRKFEPEYYANLIDNIIN